MVCNTLLCEMMNNAIGGIIKNTAAAALTPIRAIEFAAINCEIAVGNILICSVKMKPPPVEFHALLKVKINRVNHAGFTLGITI